MRLTGTRGSVSTLLATAFVAGGAAAPAWSQETATESEEGEDRERKSRSEQIVVTSQSLGTPDEATPLPVIVLTGDDLAHRRRGTLGETLDGLPGVHMDNFGGGASRPVIRGQT